MAEKKVACPWCGAEMEAAIPGVHKRLGEPYDMYCSTFYVCHGCGATGPRTEVIIGDDDGLADKTRECMEKAYTDALRRPSQKPLTFEEVLRLPDDGGNYPLHVLFRDGVTTWAMKYSLLRNIDFDNPETVERIRGIYGHEYLLYRGEITDAERAAAQWEE